jgi:hypothetical protein
MPSPRVKVDHHIAAGRQRLAAQHIARRQLIRFQAVVGGHRHFAAQHFAFTGGAYPALTGERQIGALTQCGIQDAVVFGAEGDKPIAPVLADGHRAPFRLHAGGALHIAAWVLKRSR